MRDVGQIALVVLFATCLFMAWQRPNRDELAYLRSIKTETAAAQRQHDEALSMASWLIEAKSQEYEAMRRAGHLRRRRALRSSVGLSHRGGVR